MTTHHSLYSQIPATDRLLRDPRITAVLEQFGHTATVDMLRQLQDDARRHIQPAFNFLRPCLAPAG